MNAHPTTGMLEEVVSSVPSARMVGFVMLRHSAIAHKTLQVKRVHPAPKGSLDWRVNLSPTSLALFQMMQLM